MKLDHFLIGISWFIIAHIAVFFQLNGQFKWDWFKNNEILVAAAGIIISFFLYLGNKIYSKWI